MTGNADRILANLPPTFAGLPRPTTLSALADAFGGQLLVAENSLAAVMFSHWVLQADLDSPELTDLPRIAALYGLAPRDDESIEEFRQHLLRYVRTFVDGTSSVLGLARIVGEALGLELADDALDTWWDRAGGEALTTVMTDGADAATRLLGVPTVSASATPALPATLAGSADLTAPVNLGGNTTLVLAVDGAAPVTVHLDPAADLGSIVAALAAVPGITAAGDRGRLVIRSTSTGATSALRLDDVAGDAAPAVLGIAPRAYTGTPAQRARIDGTPTLPSTVDTSTHRYLRLVVDGQGHEVDLAGVTTPSGIVAAIVAEAGVATAELVDGRLVLSSPTQGLAGTIAVATAPSSDAAELLLGGAPTYARGRDAAPATVSGAVDLSAGVDLTGDDLVVLAVDDGQPVEVHCAGANPARTTAGEIATAINAAVGTPVATQNGPTLTLSSRVAGPTGRIRLLAAPERIFGFAPREAAGSDPVPAAYSGAAVLSPAVDLRALSKLRLVVDGGDPVTVQFGDVLTAQQIVTAINAAVGRPVASTDGTRLTLTAAVSISVPPIEKVTERHFVTRAFPLGEAASTVLGTFAASAEGSAAVSGSLTGAVDLHDGLDLRSDRFLRLAFNGGPGLGVDVTARSPRPRAVLLSELLAAINAAIGDRGVASIVDGKLQVTSALTGKASAVAVLTGAGDAADAVFGFAEAAAHSQDATRLVFTGLADLSGGVDLSSADRVRIAIDGGAPVEVDCSGASTLPQVLSRINAALGGSFATTDGSHIRLGSARTGSAGSVELLAPSTRDATRLLFGVPSGRAYQGQDAVAATLTGTRQLAALDLRATPFLRLSVDDLTALVDCGTATSPDALASVITAALAGKAVASVVDGRLRITGGGRITLAAANQGDASGLLFGAATATPGADATPATVTGAVGLRKPVDLSERSVLRLAVDGGRPVDVDVSGAAPNRTFGDEIARAITVCAATIDQNGHLVLSSPNSGPDSSLAVIPPRAIEVIDYPPMPHAVATTAQRITIDNNGATDTEVTLRLTAPSGTAGFDLVGLTSGGLVSVDAITEPGTEVRVQANPDGRVTTSHGTAVATPLNALAAVVPFAGTRPLALSRPGDRPALALIDPNAANLVLLEAKSSRTGGSGVRVTAAPGGLFDVDIDGFVYAGVAIDSRAGANNLSARVSAPGGPPVLARDVPSAQALRLPRGRSEWLLIQFDAARFNAARFNHAHFAGGPGERPGVFDVSRFDEHAHFTPFAQEPPVDATFEWSVHEPGAVLVNLPDDLPPKFGARFNQSRFGTGADDVERHEVVLDPPDDDLYIGRQFANSNLVRVTAVSKVPLGWDPLPVPFRQPRTRPLTGGRADRPAALYLTDHDLPGAFQVAARNNGRDGDDIAVSVRYAGPARFTVTVSTSAARFECARAIAYAGQVTDADPLARLVAEIIAPGPVGVVQAKAAGVGAAVTRDRTYQPAQEGTQQ